MPNVLILGAQGQVGREVQEVLLYNNFTIYPLGHDDLDITDHLVVAKLLEQVKPDIIVNACAYTAVDQAEDDKELCFDVNARALKNLAKLCSELQIKLVHISTDYVFYGTDGPHNEHSKTESYSVYGQSKLQGEQYIRRFMEQFIIIRSSWIFGRYGHNFVKTMLRLGRERDEVSVVADQYGSPTPAKALAMVIARICGEISHDDFNSYGIYHFAASPYCSWADFAIEIFKEAYRLKLIDHKVNVKLISSSDYKTKARRPEDSRLNCDLIYDVFGIEMPSYIPFLAETLMSEQEDDKE